MGSETGRTDNWWLYRGGGEYDEGPGWFDRGIFWDPGAEAERERISREAENRNFAQGLQLGPANPLAQAGGEAGGNNNAQGSQLGSNNPPNTGNYECPGGPGPGMDYDSSFSLITSHVYFAHIYIFFGHINHGADFVTQHQNEPNTYFELVGCFFRQRGWNSSVPPEQQIPGAPASLHSIDGLDALETLKNAVRRAEQWAREHVHDNPYRSVVIEVVCDTAARGLITNGIIPGRGGTGPARALATADTLPGSICGRE